MDSVLKEAGDCGRFQACHVFFTQLPRFVTVWAVFLMMFGSYDPGWKCVKDKQNIYPNQRNGTTFLASSLQTVTTAFSKLPASKKVISLQEFTNNTFGNYSVDINSTGNNVNEVNKTKKKIDGSCERYKSCGKIEFNTESITVVSHFKLVCDREWIVKCIFLLQGVGYFIGALLGGQIGEKFGRKIGLYSSTLIVCLSCGVAIFSPHWSMYAVCIFFLGLGANGVISLSAVFSVEFLNSKWRGYFGSLPTWNISLLLFTVTTAAVKSWIYLHLITFIMALVASVGFLVVVESPRWLIMNGRPTEAKEAIRKIARINRKPPPNFDRLMQLQANQKVEHKGKAYTYLDLFRTKEIRITAFKLSLLMGIFGIVYYAFGWGVQSLPGDFYINAIVSSVIEILNLFIVGPLCNWAGRRKAGVIMALIGAVSCFSIVVALFAAEEGSTMQSTVIKVFAFEGKAAAQAIFAITSLFIVELLPTVVRNVGIGFCRCVAGLGTLVAPFLIPSSDVISFAVCFSILCVFYAIEIIIFLSLMETNNLDLTDSLVPTGANKEITINSMDLADDNEENQNNVLNGSV